MGFLPVMLNQLVATETVLLIPGVGVWIANLDIDLDITGIVPSGPCVITIGATALVGTIDPRGSGKFGAKAHVTVVGGGGGWDKPVPALHLHNDAGVLSTAVFAVTASSVGEVCTDLFPMPLGADYVRTAGPASRVLSGFEWWVDLTGITMVGPRVPVPFNPLTCDILCWDPDYFKADLASDEIIVPGTVLVDPRFGTATVRDIEMTFNASGARATAWCSAVPAIIVPGQNKETAGTKLARAIGAVAREAVRVQSLKLYGYRIVLQGPDGRCTLQNTSPLTSDAPAQLQAITVRPGLAGLSAKYSPGTEVTVGFIEGDFTKPVICGFGKVIGKTLEIDIDALRVAVGLGAFPVATAPNTVSAINALQTELNLVSAALTALGAIPAVSAAAAACTAAAAGVVAGASAVSSAAALVPSTKLFTD